MYSLLVYRKLTGRKREHKVENFRSSKVMLARLAALEKSGWVMSGEGLPSRMKEARLRYETSR